MEIVELRSEAELEGAFTVVRELHGELDERKYAELLAAMIPSGYRMFAVRDEGEVAAVAGVQVITNLYYERHLYVFDLVATAGARSKGHGAALMSHVEYLARREGCKYIALACGKGREGALRFYERLGFERPGLTRCGKPCVEVHGSMSIRPRLIGGKGSCEPIAVAMTLTHTPSMH